MSLSAGQQALLDVSAAFAAADTSELTVEPLLHASQEMLKLYDLMFPKKGMIYDLLKKDHEGHIKGLRKLYDADKAAGADAAAPGSLAPLLEREIAKRGMASVRGDLASGVCSTLWLMRTFAFLIRFLDNLCNPANAKDEAFDCARNAYKEVLYPFHRTLVSITVKLALGACAVVAPGV